MLSKIEKLLHSNIVSEKIELTNWVFSSDKNVKQNTQLTDLFINYLLDVDYALRIKPYDTFRFYGPRRGLASYTATQLLLMLKQNKIENKLFIHKQLLETLNNLSDSKKSLLRITRTKELLEIIRNFLGDNFYCFTDSRPCDIYYVPFESKMNNAIFDINTNSIVAFRTKKNGIFPEYVFTHEIGHMVHSLIFGYRNEVPPSFIEFNEKFKPGHFINMSKEDQLEIYADFFSIAVMLDTQYETLNPLINGFQRSFIIRIKKYFIDEFRDKLKNQ